MHTILDFFKIGIGPSSSHTTGPILASRKFVSSLKQTKKFGKVTSVKVELYGSLALTGKGHGTDVAIKLGLMNVRPDDVRENDLLLASKENFDMKLGGIKLINFSDTDISYIKKPLKYHPNGIRFIAYSNGSELDNRTYYSIGGGFVVTEKNAKKNKLKQSSKKITNEFTTAKEMFELAENRKLKLSELILENEKCFRKNRETKKKLRKIWKVMQASVDVGLTTDGILKGGLDYERRAPSMYQKYLENKEVGNTSDYIDFASICAIAVNEENANMGKVVTAPTNGAAGIVPATMMYIDEYITNKPKDWQCNFLLVAGAIAMLYKMNASISGAEVGCQGEIGVACSMAAAALTEIRGGTLKEVEAAAEIGMEHNLGLTCDPVKGLVQIPCIERNAIGVGKAINASKIAMLNEKKTKISLDAVIKTMKKTGEDMKTKYKETSKGGLAVNVTEC